MALRKLLCAAALLMLTSTADAEDIRVIPYPSGLDTTTEGASSASPEINHVDSIYYTAPDFFNMTSTADRIILPHYPTYQQSTEYSCGPASGLTVLYYYGNRDYDEMSLVEGMKTKGYPIGTSPKDLAKFFRSIGWYVDSSLEHKPFETFEAFEAWARKNLSEGTPIMVENVEWGGHWRVIIGYDTLGTDDTLDDVLIMMDPYDTSDHDQDGYVTNNAWRFYSMWFDHGVVPKKQSNQPWVIAHPKE